VGFLGCVGDRDAQLAPSLATYLGNSRLRSASRSCTGHASQTSPSLPSDLRKLSQTRQSTSNLPSSSRTCRSIVFRGLKVLTLTDTQQQSVSRRGGCVHDIVGHGFTDGIRDTFKRRLAIYSVPEDTAKGPYILGRAVRAVCLATTPALGALVFV